MHTFTPFMLRAIALAEQGRWAACPNPTVGAVLVKEGHIVAEGWHHAAGQAHAEVECLRDAAQKNINPAECTLLVTLEPCNHYGKTPPCTKAILEAGIKHVIVGYRDPNPKAAGGLEYLREQGVRVDVGLCAQQCRDLIADFLCWQAGRPYVILKMASTLDGRIATRTGNSRWISSEESRQQVHQLRAHIGSCGGIVMVGGTTFRADNPTLSARLPGYTGAQPLACVVTSRMPHADTEYILVRDRIAETIFMGSPAAAASPAAASLRQRGARVYAIERKGNSLDFSTTLEQLYTELHCPYILCEGGGKLGLSLIQADLVDEFQLHLAPRILGDNEARPLFDGLSPMHIADGIGMRFQQVHVYGGDVHMTLLPTATLLPQDKHSEEAACLQA
jgi:diaminohydroxyphosphoribosylaminopyrimidine deaminase / 5-amino-6-(5-phosphoribosylamino)uracil reductase